MIVLMIALAAPVALLGERFKPEVDAFSAQYEMWIDERVGMIYPVQPCIEIEQAWAIEDTRTYADEPLTQGMYRDGAILGYDEESRTYYCTLGMENAEAWPEISLGATGEDPVALAFVDDYTYDFCRDAIAGGYRYEMLAYTDTQYEYIGVVFTGLPMVMLDVYGDPDEMGEEDTTAYISIVGEGYEPINSGAVTHLRGGGFVKEYDKYSYNVKFRSLTGRGSKEAEYEVLGMEKCNEWLLISNAADKQCARNEIAWQLWRDWNADEQAFMIQDTRMVEVFVNNEYVGLYQLMESIKPARELLKMGGNPDTDCVGRVIKEVNVGDRPVQNLMDQNGFWMEMRYKPDSMSAEHAFSVFEPYLLMNIQNGNIPVKELDNETFAQICERCTDVRETLDYFLFIQAAGLCFDNVFNNVYMWAMKQGDHYVYMCSPWDMDMAFTKMFGSDEDIINLYLRQTWRMLDMDLLDARSMVWEIWNEKRSTIISDDAMYQRFVDFEEMINASGAYLRETLKWHGAEETLDLTEVRSFAVSHLSTVDRAMREMWPEEGAEAIR